VSSEWAYTTLGEVSDFQGGSQPPKSQFVDKPTDGYIRLLQIRDFKRDDKAVYVPVSAKNKVCASDDIMIGRYGASVGQIHRGKAGAYNVALIRTIPNDKVVDRDYLYFYLTSPLFQKPLLEVSTSRSAQAGFSKPDIVGFPFPLPPLPEQKQIVAILDKAFAAIDQAVANAERNLTNARELFESYLNRVFTERGEGWVEKRLDEVCENLDSQRIPITKNKRTSGDIPYYGASGIVDYVADYIFDEELLLVSEDGANLLARTYPIAFSVSGKTWVNNHAHVLQFESSDTLKFVEYYLNSISLEPYVSGMAQPKLNQKSLNSILISLPTEIEKHKIIKKLDELVVGTTQLETIYQKKLTALTELKQSILQKAFRGELTAGDSYG